MENSTPEQPASKKPGPSGEPKWAEKVVRGIVVGRDKKIVPPEEVEHFASLGCSDREIANYFDVSESTLRYNFSSYLTKGRHQLRTTLRQAQLRLAIEHLNPTMLVWLGKNVLGQSDTPISGDDNRALPWTDDPETIEAQVDEIEEADDYTTE